MGAKFPRNESSRERKLARIFVPGSERAGPFRSRERKFRGAKWPGSELAGVLLADSLLGVNGPGSEKARYQTKLTLTVTLTLTDTVTLTQTLTTNLTLTLLKCNVYVHFVDTHKKVFPDL